MQVDVDVDAEVEVDVKKKRVDYTDAEECREVTFSALRELSIALELPDDALCPPVPNRLNYIHWLSSLQPIQTHVLDIGVGSSCIYPLLGRREYGWRFTGVDVDAAALAWAARNVTLNAAGQDIALALVPRAADYVQAALSCGAELTTETLCERLTSLDRRDASMRGPLRHALAALGTDYAERLLACEAVPGLSSSSYLLPSTSLLSAVMCNPPFYDLREAIGSNPFTVCTGKPSEMRTEGGEVSFVLAIVADSLVMKSAVGWYTTLLGKKSSLGVLVPVLRQLGVPVLRTTRLEQGRTHRWGLAWSFAEVYAAAAATSSSSINPRAFTRNPYAVRSVSRRIALSTQPPLTPETIVARALESLQQQSQAHTQALMQGEGLGHTPSPDEWAVRVEAGPAGATLVLSGFTAMTLKAFDALCGRLQSDIKRTNRCWRRQVRPVPPPP